jgi:hypothetical protein
VYPVGCCETLVGIRECSPGDIYGSRRNSVSEWPAQRAASQIGGLVTAGKVDAFTWSQEVVGAVCVAAKRVAEGSRRREHNRALRSHWARGCIRDNDFRYAPARKIGVGIADSAVKADRIAVGSTICVTNLRYRYAWSDDRKIISSRATPRAGRAAAARIKAKRVARPEKVNVSGNP